MLWKFILDNGTTQLPLDIPPVGWDTGTANIVRDSEKHGVAFDYAIGNVRYYEAGAQFISDAYDSLGTEAKVNLIIQYRCSEHDTTWIDFYTGKLDYATYQRYYGVNCYVMINVEATNVVMTFNNRFDQKVDLETLASFDGVPLDSYDMLGTEIVLPAKAIPLADHFKNDNDVSYDFAGGLQAITNETFGRNVTHAQLNVGFETEVASEIGGTYSSVERSQIDINHAPPTPTTLTRFTLPMYNLANGQFNSAAYYYPLFASPIINMAKEFPNSTALNGDCQLDFQLSGNIKADNCYINNISIGLAILREVEGQILDEDGIGYHTNGEERNDYITERHIVVGQSSIYWGYDIFDAGPNNTNLNDWLGPGESVPFDFGFSSSITLLPGDRVYFLIGVGESKTQAQINAVTNGANGYTLNLDAGNYFKLTNLSLGGNNTASPAKSFLINESLSRITEAITNNEMKAYSDYFGRTDALPYPSGLNGCGGLEMITNGLFIRGIDKVRTDTPPIMSVSLKDMFEGLNPIHNIGYGIEDDTNRPGFKMLRVEPMEYFYPDNVIYSATKIAVLVRKCLPAKIYSKYLFGYEKWEAQQYTGLDEFLTKREYRTSLTSVSNTLSQVSKFVASGYTIEIVRRIGNITSKDNSYDDETFIVCLKFGSTKEFTDVVWSQNTITNEYTLNAPGLGAFVGGASKVVIGGGGFISDPLPVSSEGNDLIRIPISGWPYPIVSTITVGVQGYFPEQGNILSPTNIIDPATIYNYRISPVRNAMRWSKSIFQSYKNRPEELIYTDGDGNVYASGQLSTPDPCKLEAVDIKENMTVTPAIFSNSSEAAPVFKPELVTFDYPVSYEDFINIKSNRMGLIEFEHDGVTETGWINNLQYVFETGMATFELIPKFE